MRTACKDGKCQCIVCRHVRGELNDEYYRGYLEGALSVFQAVNVGGMDDDYVEYRIDEINTLLAELQK